MQTESAIIREMEMVDFAQFVDECRERQQRALAEERRRPWFVRWGESLRGFAIDLFS